MKSDTARKIIFLVAVVVGSAKLAQAQQETAPRAATNAPAILSGVVKDEYGDPLSGAEVRFDSGARTVYTDSTGVFRIESSPGDFTATFRRLGYAPEDFSWRARRGETTTLSIRLNPVPRGLDPIVVRDNHNRVAGASSIAGVVVNSSYHEVSGVELQLIGTGRHAITYEDGAFFIAGLAEGNYVIRARRMGFTPVNLTVKVGSGERHEVAIKLDELPHTLSTVQVTERSGFGASALAWEEFDRRERWRGASTSVVGRDELARKGRMPLDWALRGSSAASLLMLPGWFGGGTNHTSIVTTGVSTAGSPGIEGDQCVLVNGLIGERRPLSSFDAREVERVEVYAANTDWTATIASRMHSVLGCESPDDFHHPPYFVIWMRGGS